MSNKLTYKQQRFCEEYIYDWNATRAAIAAGYSEKTSFTIGCENLKKPYIQSYISEIQKDLEKQAGISRLKVLNEYKAIAFSNLAEMFRDWTKLSDFNKLTTEQKKAIAEITHKKQVVGDTDIETEFVKIKMYDKQKALDSICKMLGYDIEENNPDENKTINLTWSWGDNPEPEKTNESE